MEWSGPNPIAARVMTNWIVPSAEAVEIPQTRARHCLNSARRTETDLPAGFLSRDSVIFGEPCVQSYQITGILEPPASTSPYPLLQHDRTAYPFTRGSSCSVQTEQLNIKLSQDDQCRISFTWIQTHLRQISRAGPPYL